MIPEIGIGDIRRVGEEVLVVLFIHSHVVLIGMVACGALYRGLGAYIFVAADEAFPLDGVGAFPYCAVLNLLEVTAETFEVMLLDGSDRTEMVGDFGETLFIGYLGGIGIHLHTLEFLFAHGGGKVGGCVADHTGVNITGHLNFSTFEELKEYLGVVHLVGRSLAEDYSYREVKLLVSLGSIERVTGICHRFGRISSYQVLLGLSSFDRFLCCHSL